MRWSRPAKHSDPTEYGGTDEEFSGADPATFREIPGRTGDRARLLRRAGMRSGPRPEDAVVEEDGETGDPA